jgi:hypothetical protein
VATDRACLASSRRCSASFSRVVCSPLASRGFAVPSVPLSASCPSPVSDAASVPAAEAADAERAASLVDAVLSRVPVRRWLLTLPYRLRYYLAGDHTLCRAVLGVYARALLSFFQPTRRGLPGLGRPRRCLLPGACRLGPRAGAASAASATRQTSVTSPLAAPAPRGPAAAPLRPPLDREPAAAQDGSGSKGDRGADPRLCPGKAGSPGVWLGGPQRGGRILPTRVARSGSRRSSVCPSVYEAAGRVKWSVCPSVPFHLRCRLLRRQVRPREVPSAFCSRS